MIQDDDELQPTIGDISRTNVTSEVLRIVAACDDKTAPEAVLEAAKDPASVLHGYFTWDDSEAGRRYRLAQAGKLYRTVKMEIMRLDAEQREIKFETIRAVVSVPADRSKTDSRSYGRTQVVMSDEARRESVLRGIVRDLVALRNKHARYSELSDVWVVIDDAALMYDSAKPKSRSAKLSKASPPPVA